MQHPHPHNNVFAVHLRKLIVVVSLTKSTL